MSTNSPPPTGWSAIAATPTCLRDLSFDTISGAGPNGAIVHYRVTPETNRKLEPGTLYLVDSGGQYPDGTTDVTRTVAIGAPTAEMRRRFTLVLKGHIALARARFPAGTTGSQLDTLARMALWADGLDYDHGTGHGVGSYLSVHEGPQRISKLPNSIALQPGMIVSNEPGYYRTGQYGIRIENLVAVRDLDMDGAERPMLGFETLTLAPIDRTLIDRGLLTAEEGLGRRLSRPRPRTDRPAGRSGNRRLAGRGDATPVTAGRMAGASPEFLTFFYDRSFSPCRVSRRFEPFSVGLQIERSVCL